MTTAAAVGLTMMAVQAAGSAAAPVPTASATVAAVPGSSATHKTKPRIIAMEDAEIDDMDSMIRLLYYSNEFNIAGIVATSSTYHYKGNLGDGGNVYPFRWTGVEWLNRYIDLYDQIRPNLVKHAFGWPTADYLRSIYKIGNIDTVGDMSKSTEGSDLIKATILDDDPEPLYALAWGGTNTLARALQDIQTQYQDTDQWPAIQAKVNSKLTIYNILTQDNTLADYIKPNWPGVKIIDNHSQFWGFAYLWQRATPPPLKQYLQAPYMDANLLENTGPLMQEYRTFGDGNPTVGDDENTRWDPAKLGSNARHDFISEGDSPSFMFLLNFNGLRSAEDPMYGGWGGRFTPNATGWTDTGDPVSAPEGSDVLRYAQLRWLAEFQNDFAARIQWGVTPNYSGANHIPTASVRGGLDLTKAPGETVTLHARAADPDSDALSYRWWEYTDADTYGGTTPMAVTAADTLTPSFTVPVDAKTGDTLHLILQVTDNGSPAMTYYQRVIVTVVNDPPQVSFTSPADGATVSGKLNIRVKLGGDDLQAYNLRLDAGGLQYAYRPGPGVQSYKLDTSNLSNGEHVLLATATDVVGHKTTVTQKIIVNN